MAEREWDVTVGVWAYTEQRVRVRAADEDLAADRAMDRVTDRWAADGGPPADFEVEKVEVVDVDSD
jgi:hypothetical protein